VCLELGLTCSPTPKGAPAWGWLTPAGDAERTLASGCWFWTAPLGLDLPTVQGTLRYGKHILSPKKSQQLGTLAHPIPSPGPLLPQEVKPWILCKKLEFLQS